MPHIMRNKRLARWASLLLISLTEFAARRPRIKWNPFLAAACTPQKTLCAERSEIPSGKKASPFYPTSQRISPYSALAAVPKTMTGPAMTNIFAAVPVTIPSACVKIGHIFFCFSRIIGFSPTVISYFFSKAYHPARLATAFMISSVKSS